MRHLALTFLIAASLGLFALACEDSEDKKGSGTEDVVEDTAVCKSQCKDKECGPNGCGGYCGACEEGFSCNADGSCEELPSCVILHEIGCGGGVSGTTVGGENQIDDYNCKGFMGAGSDVGYFFAAAQDDHVVFELSSPMADLDVLVTQSPCKPATCLAWADDKLELDVTAGIKYYVMIDGQEGVQGAFDLSVRCDSLCKPECDGKECGDDGCGGSCGECPMAAPFCADHKCKIECTSHCDMKECGDDGCGGSCGNCPLGFECSQGGACVEEPPPEDGCEAQDHPGCNGCICEACVCALMPECCAAKWDQDCAKMCGAGDCVGCEGEGQFGWPCDSHADCVSNLCIEGMADGLVCSVPCAKSCPDGWSCVIDPEVYQGKFCSTHCIPDCTGKECGSDGCGGSCGICPMEHSCFDGVCMEGPSGSCMNDADLGIIMEMAEGLFDKLPMCAMECMDMPESDCATPCVQEQTGLSQDCAQCYAEFGTCTMTNCFPACMESFGTPQCGECLEEAGCDTDLQVCGGF